MRMSCNGCRVLRKGCSEDCSIRPCLEWIKSAESQANATLFLAKFYGRAGLINLINAGPNHLRPAVFRSLLYEACGRIVNPIYGSVGLLWSGSWQLCQAAVEAVLKGMPITPINSELAESGRGPTFKAHDIRHVSKPHKNTVTVASHETKRVKTRSRIKKPKVAEVAKRASSHESSLSHERVEAVATAAEGESKEIESDVSVETTTITTTVRFHDEPDSDAKGRGGSAEVCGNEVGLELTLGFETVSREHDVVVPMKKRRIDLKDFCGGVSSDNGSCKMELGLQFQAFNGSVLT
ncbi:LOB domain-containing protein 40-like [Arachis stenosperma]|uniref:LOB domain-containing protein 40-like n=1 Tax=Arachis stenosperma TaxID=217475 RepID=UPI0025ACAA0C|nr:LOB domain-containing protein 40-like [Arachis stenosperma]